MQRCLGSWWCLCEGRDLSSAVHRFEWEETMSFWVGSCGPSAWFVLLRWCLFGSCYDCWAWVESEPYVCWERHINKVKNLSGGVLSGDWIVPEDNVPLECQLEAPCALSKRTSCFNKPLKKSNSWRENWSPFKDFLPLHPGVCLRWQFKYLWGFLDKPDVFFFLSLLP